MINTLLVVHIIVGFLLVISILLQKNSSESLANLAGNASGVVSAKGAANFLTKTTIILGAIFMVNAIVLGNLSTRKAETVLEQNEKNAKTNEQEIPLAE